MKQHETHMKHIRTNMKHKTTKTITYTKQYENTWQHIKTIIKTYDKTGTTMNHMWQIWKTCETLWNNTTQYETQI